jgi:anti-sigma-K factor RskA
MRSLTLDELRELAPGYVMGTLSADELAFFHASLTDPTIAAQLAPEIAAHRAAMEFLAEAQAVTPPPSLKSRLADRIARERMATERLATEPRALGSVAADDHSDDEGATAAAIEPTLSLLRGTPDGVPAVRRATHFTPAQSKIAVPRRSPAPWILSGVMALAAAASVLFAVSQQNRVREVQEQLRGEQLVAKNQAQRLANRDSTVNTLTHAETNLVLVTLAPTDAKARTMQVFWNRQTGEAVVHASGFAPVARDRAYCLWIIRDGKPEAVKLFTPDDDGHRLINNVRLPLNVKGISAMAVTEEPAAGSPQPTMQPFLIGAVTAAP